MNELIFENARFRLTVGEDALVRSLILCSTGEELADAAEEIPLFSVTQERPFNNEVKLAHPNKRTLCPANRLRMEDGRLIVGFELAPYEAVIDVKTTDAYLAFTLADFIVHPDDYPGLRMSPPPVKEFRVAQLPVKNRERFGEWLNVCWDDRAAVCLLAASPYPRIDSEKRKDCRILTADCVRELKLKGVGAALIVSSPGEFLDCVDALEADFGLPRGVQSRRGDKINASAYWSADVNPNNVDEHIMYAKMGGFRMMLLYYTSIFQEAHGYGLSGNYDYRDEYPNGAADVKVMLDKIKAAGITPGLHFLQTHIGLWSRYVTPVADHRLNLTRRFTLKNALGTDDTVLTVEENPEGSVLCDGCRILQFGGELISYESCTTERPYRFEGCRRGAYDTIVTEHPAGQIGGILDVSEFGAVSCYLDQNSDLQDEVAEKIADAYNAGFRFCYFDGSEGTNAPHEFHVPNAQYRVLQKFSEAPIYTEGAAKAHFGWHHLSGGNAFDIFAPDIFKKMIDRYPAEEAPRMRNDFTRLNFGWWGFWAPGTQADQYEYGTSRAAAWDCPITVQTNLAAFRAHPRTRDILEVMRRWEDVRERKLLTDEQKEMLKVPGQEHILLRTPDDGFALVAYFEMQTADPRLRAYRFSYDGAQYAVYWITDGDGTVRLPLTLNDAVLELEPLGEKTDFARDGGDLLLPGGDRLFLRTGASEEELAAAFGEAVIE